MDLYWDWMFSPYFSNQQNTKFFGEGGITQHCLIILTKYRQKEGTRLLNYQEMSWGRGGTSEPGRIQYYVKKAAQYQQKHKGGKEECGPRGEQDF